MTTILETLPTRPLTFEEADVLAESETVAPLTVLGKAPKPELPAGVYTLFVNNETKSESYVLGYSARQGGWVVVDKWDFENWTVEKKDATVQRWLREEYPDMPRGEIDVDTGESHLLDD